MSVRRAALTSSQLTAQRKTSELPPSETPPKSSPSGSSTNESAPEQRTASKVDPTSSRSVGTRTDVHATQAPQVLAQRLPEAAGDVGKTGKAGVSQFLKQAEASLNASVTNSGVVQAGLDKALEQVMKRGGNLTLANYEALAYQRTNLGVQAELATRRIDMDIKSLKKGMHVYSQNPFAKQRLSKMLAMAQQKRTGILKGFDQRYAKLTKHLDDVKVNAKWAQGISNRTKTITKIGNGLAIASGLLNGVKVGRESSATTPVGKLVSGVLAGGLNAAANWNAGGWMALDALSGGHLSNGLNGTVETAVALAEWYKTGSRQAAQDLGQRMQNGEFGGFLRTGHSGGLGVEAIFDPAKRAEFIRLAEQGDLGRVAQFGNALGEGIGRLLFGGD